MHSLKTILLLFFRVAIFRTPPQDIPASEVVLVISIAFSLLAGLLRYAVVGYEYYSLLRVFLEPLISGILIYLLLAFFKLPGRFSQCFAAVCGSGAIIYLFALPVLPSFFATESSLHQLSVYIIIAIDLWSVAVLAYILKHTVNAGFATGISLAVALVLLTLIVVENISPTRQPADADHALDQNIDQAMLIHSSYQPGPLTKSGPFLPRIWHRS